MFVLTSVCLASACLSNTELKMYILLFIRKLHKKCQRTRTIIINVCNSDYFVISKCHKTVVKPRKLATGH